MLTRIHRLDNIGEGDGVQVDRKWRRMWLDGVLD